MNNLVSKHSGVIPSEIRTKISARYKTVTKAINREFWDSSSDNLHSFYVGSYGRGTAVNTSDIDILIEIPQTEQDRFGNLSGNGQSKFLQVVKEAIKAAYPRSDIRADGQVIKVNFSDGIKFEILPAFKKVGWLGAESYIYPDSNMGGNWRSTNPKVEQAAMKEKNNNSNCLLQATCRHFRYIRDTYFSSYHLSGIVIDSFVYAAMENWTYMEPGKTGNVKTGDYEKKLQKYLTDNTLFGTLTISSPGSEQNVDTKSSIDCLKKVVDKIAG